MSKSVAATVLLVCAFLCPAVASGDSPNKGATDAPSLDASASAYRASLGPFLEAPLQYRGTSRAHAITEMLSSLTTLPGTGTPEKAAPLPTKDRGDVDWAQVYTKTAPAVVFLAGENGFGTGFVIDADQRWVITNHHVARAAALDDERHWQMNAYFGELGDNGVMQPSDSPMQAVVYRWDPQRDLALLKLERTSQTLRQLELVKDAKAHLPKSGQDVALIGNGALGLLWAMKPGYIASMGTLSRNLPYLVSRMNQVHGLDPAAALQPGVIERLQQEVGKGFEGWIGGNTLLIQSTAQATQGDSGGPLINEKAKVVGIAMGLRMDQETASSVSYYIHVDEIRDFVSGAPAAPLLEVASSFWETNAVAYSLADATGDGRIDVIQGYDANQQVVMCAADLDQDTELKSLFSSTPVRMPVVGVYPTKLGTVTVYENGILIGSEAGSVAWQQRQVGRVASAALAPDASVGALGHADGSVGVFDTAAGVTDWRKAIDGTAVTAMAFSGNSQSLWLGTTSGTLVEVSTSGDLMRTITLQNGILSIAASPNGQYVAVAEVQGSVRMYEAKNGRELWSNPDLPAYVLRFSADSHHLVASPQGSAKQLYWMNTWSGEVARELSLPGSPYSFELSEDGAAVAVLLHEQGRYVVAHSETSQLISEWKIAAENGDTILDRLLAGAPASNRPVESFCFAAEKLFTGDASGMVYEVDLVNQGSSRGFRHEVIAPDMDAIVASQSFDAEFAWLLDSRANSCYVMYDLDNDEQFDLIRVDDAADLVLDSEYRREQGNLVRQDARGDGGVFLHPSQLPSPWQANYLVSLGGS